MLKKLSTPNFFKYKDVIIITFYPVSIILTSLFPEVITNQASKQQKLQSKYSYKHSYCQHCCLHAWVNADHWQVCCCGPQRPHRCKMWQLWHHHRHNLFQFLCSASCWNCQSSLAWSHCRPADTHRLWGQAIFLYEHSLNKHNELPYFQLCEQTSA